MYFRENFLLSDQAGRRHLTISDSHPLLSGLGLHPGKRRYALCHFGINADRREQAENSEVTS